ncbi:MAG: mechanosensitive ion channel protein MscS [Crocinitomicaceae bacterium]|nr:mechanosensitive ion channel protein MscS [Crocinitomicaceae bacterium]|tara:strand:+ start:1982 stop:2803 length:822 start_codon:yes stop_codon:yes gene_type:complete
MNTEELQSYFTMAYDFIIEYGLQLVGAVIALIVGLFIIKSLTNALKNILEKKNVDPSLRPFLTGMFNMVLKILLMVSILGMVGIEMTSFIAILGAASLAVGMALSGTLQNFAGGVIILIFKPFKVGDYIDAQGYSGTVNAISIINTILKTPDNKTIIIPNGPLSTGSLTNFSTEPKRRVDWTVGIAYGDNVDQAKEVMFNILNNDTRVLKDPAPFIAVSALADSSVNFTVRVWVNASDYWPLFFEFNEQVYKRFNEEGINIPFPQMDVHVHKD